MEGVNPSSCRSGAHVQPFVIDLRVIDAHTAKTNKVVVQYSTCHVAATDRLAMYPWRDVRQRTTSSIIG